MTYLTEEEQSRRAMTDEDLRHIRQEVVLCIVELGGDQEHPERAMDERGDVVRDVDRILQGRKNQRAAEALMRDPSWPTTWRETFRRITREMLDAHDEHVVAAREALRACIAAIREHVPGEPLKKTPAWGSSSDWHDLYAVLRHICLTLPADETNEVVVAFRRVLKDREEPTYSWANKSAIGEPPEPVDPAEKARADEHLERYFQVWDDLSVVVRGFPARVSKRES